MAISDTAGAVPAPETPQAAVRPQERPAASRSSNSPDPTPEAVTQEMSGLPGAPERDANPAPAELAHWKRRALRAEAAVSHALWMRPLGPHWTGIEPETADQMRLRFRHHMEDRYPDLITRYEHQRIEVLQIADGCGCDRDADDWGEFHSECGEGGESLCVKTRLGFVCDSCENEDGDGPAWKPYAVEWPCAPIAELDASEKAVTA